MFLALSLVVEVSAAGCCGASCQQHCFSTSQLFLTLFNNFQQHIFECFCIFIILISKLFIMFRNFVSSDLNACTLIIRIIDR